MSRSRIGERAAAYPVGDGRAEVATDGRCFAYVFPCAWEDHCKIGFSTDPLGRISALHQRWFDFFDLEGGMLVEAESIRDARDLELELRAGLGGYNAPAPMTIRVPAGGHTEWFRGVSGLLHGRIEALASRGYRAYPLRSVDELEGLLGATAAQRRVRDVLDAFQALDIDVEPLLAPAVLGWYRGSPL